MNVKKNIYKRSLKILIKSYPLKLKICRILYKAYKTDTYFYSKNFNKLIELSFYGDNIIDRLKNMKKINYQKLEYYIYKFGNEIGTEKYNEYISLKAKLNSKESFIERFGKEKGIEKWNKKIESFLGEKNPGWQHNGRLSPWSENSKFYNKEAISKSIITRKENNSYNTTLNFYIKQGYSEEQSKQLLSERQRTFTLEKCIQKYGVEEGTNIWQKRQDKWQKTINNKSDEEKIIINRKKGIDKEGNPHTYYNEKLCTKRPELSSIPTELYYVKLTKNDKVFYKIGISKNGYKKRLGKVFCGYNVELVCSKHTTLEDAIFLEQIVLKKYNGFRLYNPDEIKSTEIFSKEIFNGDYSFIRHNQ